MHEGSRKAIVAAFLANLGIAIAKFVGFAITGAASLLFLGGRRVRASVPIARLIYLEPDLYRPEAAIDS